VQWVEEFIRIDKGISLDSAAPALGGPHGLVYSIIYDRLKFRKVCARWLPRELKDRGQMRRMDLFLQHLLVLRYADEGEDIVT
jgi:hypothetical protein